MHAILLSGLLTLSAPAADDTLRGAIERGDVERVKEYIAADADLDRLYFPPAPAFDPKRPFFMTEGQAMVMQQVMEHNAHIELPLCLAITLGKKDVARVLLEGGADPGKQMRNGRTAVHVAVIRQDADTLTLMIQRKAPLDTADTRGGTPLMLALHVPVLAKLLLEAGADVNRADDQGRTPLHWVVENNNAETFDLLLRYKADPDRVNKEGHTPLHLAVKRRYVPLAEKLLAAGAKADVAEAAGLPVLVDALSRDEYDLAQFLLDRGARVDRRDPKGQTPLHWSFGYPGALRFLLTHKADVNARDDEGRTALHLAIEKSAAGWSRIPESMVVLLRNGTDPSIKDNKGRTPFDVAVEIKNDNACRILALFDPKVPKADPLQFWPENSQPRKHFLEIKKGLEDGTLKPDSPDEYGVPLLARAAHSGENALVELLLAHKADVNVKLKDGSSPLYLTAVSDSWLGARLLLDAGAGVKDQTGAFGPMLLRVVETGNVETARLLLARGIECSKAHWLHNGQTEMTPLHLAIEKNDVAMVELLLEHKADPNVKAYHGGVPPALFAYERKRRLILDLLLADKRLDVNRGNNSELTLLHKSAEMGDVKLIDRLLDLGANVNALERKMYSPLYWACSHNHVEAAKLLIERGAHTTFQVQRDGKVHDVSMLHAAAAARWPQNAGLVEMLLKKGLDPNCRDARGRTPLHYVAGSFGNVQVLRVLLKHGADPKARDDQGQTPLDLAKEKNLKEAVELLNR